MSGHVCGTGVWSGPLPGDPDTNAILTATPAFGGIDVTWTAAITNAHAVAHTYLYRSTTADFATSVRIALVGGTHFYDKLENQLTYYYWIQVVSINGTVGQVIGPAFAVPRLSIDATIEALTGRIDNGVLAQSLKSEIDRISLIDGDLFQEIQDRIAANELLGAAIQIAQTDASQAVSLLNEEITQRTTAYNVLLQSLNTMAGQVNDNQAAIQNEATLRISNDEALAQQITNVQSAVGDDLAAVQTTLQTNIDTVNGKVTDIGALYTAKVKVNGLIGGFAVYNDGTEVQAGFDVDTFWVGRTGPDKKKPFIIDSDTGETYIDKAVIPTLTADMIDTRGLSIKDADGNIILAAGNALDWSRIGGTGKPENGATVGADSSNLRAGRGVNLLFNAGLSLSAEGFEAYGGTSIGLNHPGWCIKDGGAKYGTHFIHGTTAVGGAFYVSDTTRIPVIAGKRYEAYAYTGAHSCTVTFSIDFYNSAGTNIGNGTNRTFINGPANDEQASGGTSLVGYRQIGEFCTAPAGAATARLIVWKGATKAGFSDSWLFTTMPYFGEAGAAQTEPSPWVEGASGINTQITPSNVTTYIANAAIGAAQIGSIELVGESAFKVRTNNTAGARMDMDSRRIKIFDASGTLRVQLGDLTV